MNKVACFLALSVFFSERSKEVNGGMKMCEPKLDLPRLTGPALSAAGEIRNSFERGKALVNRCHELIPGGCHTYAKGDDQFPQLAPSFIARGKGCRVWDLDGNEYIEYGMGLRRHAGTRL